MSIGQRLRTARKNRGMTQAMLADKIGASRGVITNIELDKVDNPQPMVVSAICNTLNIDKNWLITGAGTMEINHAAAHSAKVLAEIYSRAKDLSEEEQLFILDMIKIYAKHMKEGDY